MASQLLSIVILFVIYKGLNYVWNMIFKNRKK